MLWDFPEPITLDPANPLDGLDATYFVDLGELVRFIGLLCARWAYAYVTAESGQKPLVPDRVHPRARISHSCSYGLTSFSILLGDRLTGPHQFRIPGPEGRVFRHIEACQWYEQLCDAIDRLMVYGLAGPPSKCTKRQVEIVNKIKICENCATRNQFRPKPATHFEGRWLCYDCVEAIEKKCLQEERRQEKLAALTAKYGDEEEVVRRLAMEEERKKLTPSLRLKILERDQFTCQLCGRTPPEVKLTVDHKFPVAEGGKTEEDNLWTLCRECNAGKRDRIIELPEWV